jgi:hypothetical protein
MSANETGSASVDPVIAAAREYAARGWRVFPLNGKVPFAGTRGFKDATTELQPDRWPAGANVGIATGGGLAVLDVDYRHDGDESLHELEQRYGRLPRTASVKTGNGGEHLYFATRREVRNSTDRLGRGLDVRGDGGYVVGPPSKHPDTGRVYAWDEHPDETPPARLPDWLERLLVEQHNGRARPVSECRRLAANGVVEGGRNDSTARLAGHLIARRVDYFVCLELVRVWNRCRNQPPLSDDEVARVVRSIARRELEKWT